MDIKEKRRPLFHPANPEREMNIIHKPMLDLLKALRGCGSVGFEVTADGG